VGNSLGNVAAFGDPKAIASAFAWAGHRLVLYRHTADVQHELLADRAKPSAAQPMRRLPPPISYTTDLGRRSCGEPL